MQGHETFMEAGGETFTLIPCINDSPVWVEGSLTYAARRAKLKPSFKLLPQALI